MRVRNAETWITARALVKRGWVATPRHAKPGRHACESTRRGRRVVKSMSTVGVKTWA